MLTATRRGRPFIAGVGEEYQFIRIDDCFQDSQVIYTAWEDTAKKYNELVDLSETVVTYALGEVNRLKKSCDWWIGQFIQARLQVRELTSMASNALACGLEECERLRSEISARDATIIELDLINRRLTNEWNHLNEKLVGYEKLNQNILQSPTLHQDEPEHVKD